MRRPGQPQSHDATGSHGPALAWLASAALVLLPSGAFAQVTIQPPAPPPPEPAKPPEAKPIDAIGPPQAEPPPVQPPPPETAPLPPGGPARGAGPPEEGRTARRRLSARLPRGPAAWHVALVAQHRRPARRAHARLRRPMPPNDWMFQFTGFMNVTAQFGMNERPEPAHGQRDTVLHVPPNTARRVPVVRQHLDRARQLDPDELPLRQPGRDGEPDALHLEPVAAHHLLSAGQPGLRQQRLLDLQRRPARQAAAARERSATSSTTTEISASTPPACTTMPYVGGARGVGGLLAAEYPLTPEVSLHRRRRDHGQPQRAAPPRGSRRPTRTTTSIRCSAPRTSSTCTPASSGRRT